MNDPATVEGVLAEMEARAEEVAEDPYAIFSLGHESITEGTAAAAGFKAAEQVTTLCAKVGYDDVPRLVAALRYCLFRMECQRKLIAHAGIVTASVPGDEAAVLRALRGGTDDTKGV